MAREIIFDRQVNEFIKSGSSKIAAAVGSTLGPKGRNVGISLIQPQTGEVYGYIIVHDGVTVAENVKLENNFEDFGAAIVRQAARTQVEEVGDGTTVTIVLADAILGQCLEMIAAGKDPMGLQDPLEKAAARLIDEIDKIKSPVKTLEQKIQIATISCNDPDLGKMIGEIIDKVGHEGVVTVEEAKEMDTYVDHQEGMQFEHGYKHFGFITDMRRMEATVEDPYILLCDKELNNIDEFVPLFEKIAQETRNLVVIAPDITGTVLQSLLLTKQDGKMNILAVKAPSYELKQKAWLQDIAILTGGTVVGTDLGIKFDKLTVAVLGRAKRVTATKESTIISGGFGEKQEIDDRIESLRTQIADETSEYEKEKLRERIGKLSSGVAVVNIGGSTEVERREKKERAIDAVHATQAAVSDGIVPGGEVALIKALDCLGQSDAEGILKRALLRPFTKLVENAGMNAGEMLAALRYKTTSENAKTLGLDVKDGQFKDMLKFGIVDPAKVTKGAIMNAVSVSIKLMTTGCLIVDQPKKEDKK